MSAAAGRYSPVIVLIFFAVVHVAFSFSLNDKKATWLNVPPAVNEKTMDAIALGDRAMIYRAAAIMLQNIGNTGGRNERFEKYDYKALKDWFIAAHKLDAESDVMPALAAYYYSASEDRAQLSALVDYLEIAGDVEKGQKWRWMAQGAYIARFRMNDLPRALEIANHLNNAQNPSIPAWGRQMSAIILGDMGEKQAALGIILELMDTRGDVLAPQELFVMKEYMCRALISPDEAIYADFCETL
jgi:hypothetical protein